MSFKSASGTVTADVAVAAASKQEVTHTVYSQHHMGSLTAV